MSSAISRAALASINLSRPSGGDGYGGGGGGGGGSSSTRYVPRSNDTYGKTKVGEYAKRTFASKPYDYDDGSSDDDNDNGERYSIDPSVELWKSIDFGAPKNAPGNAAGINKGKVAGVHSPGDQDFGSSVGGYDRAGGRRGNGNNGNQAATTYQTPTNVGTAADVPSLGSSGGGVSRGPRPRPGATAPTYGRPPGALQDDDFNQRGDRNGASGGNGGGGSDMEYTPSFVGGGRRFDGPQQRMNSSSNNNNNNEAADARTLPVGRSIVSAPGPDDASRDDSEGYVPSAGTFGARAGRITASTGSVGFSSKSSRADARDGGGGVSTTHTDKIDSSANEPWDTWDSGPSQRRLSHTVAEHIGRGNDVNPAEDVTVAAATDANKKGAVATATGLGAAALPTASSTSLPRVVSTGKDELRAMMEALLREKEEMARQLEQERAAAAAARAQQQATLDSATSQAETDAAAQERARLQAALEAAEAQNRALAERMAAQQSEAMEAVEKERAERERAMQQMAAQNELLSQQVLDMQSLAEKKLAEERNALRQAVKRMEAEKAELALRVRETEEVALERAAEADRQRREFEDNLRSLELEKSSLAQRVAANEAQAAEASAAVAEQLKKERQALCERIGRMEAEKRALAESLTETETRAQAQAAALAAQLEAEKATLLENAARMEREKKEMADRLLETEKHAQARAAEIAAQLKAEKEAVQAALLAAEEEKNALASRIEQNQTAGQEAAGAAAEALRQEREALQQRLDDMAREREELTSKLSHTESLAQQREASLAEALANEKKELLLTVQRMKAERAEEKRVADEAAAAAAKEAADAAAAFAFGATEGAEASPGGVLIPAHMVPTTASVTQGSPMLTPKRSIQDLLREECHLNTAAGGDPGISTFQGVGGAKGLPRVQSHLRKENMVPRAIVAIPEENDESRGDDGDGRRRKMAKKRTAQVLDGSADGSGKPAIILPAPMHTTSPGTAASLFQAEAEHVAVVSTAASGRVDGEGLAASLGSRSEAGDKDEDASSVKSFTEADLDYSANPQHADNEDDDNDEGEVDEDPFQSLPAPHAAAARGDLDRLKVLEALEPSLLTSFDEAQRSPLFYAVAYGHDEVVDYLLNIAPELSLATDAHGDTPMHAAASAGSAGCLDRLISAAFGEADPRNAMDMSPAHLARNVECLEVLFRHGADLAAVDVNGRSPLFVACAMNREACAEYLIGCLDESETSLLICDKRGDTPLHAAACNGAVDCLLMLLQFGIDPRSTNAVGLKAVDLAIRNKQKKCRELLAEYHLHYCTSSDFDSVLFLKTLEGHRSVKKYEMAMKGQLNGSSSHSLAATADGDSSGLRRVGSHNRSFTGGSSGGGLTRPRSIFSMKNASVRLQRWGSWLSYEDPQTKKEYWYNHRTGVGQFEKPDKVRELQIRAMSLGDDAGIAGASQQQAVNMKLKRKGDWIEYVTEEGKTFFYNEKNGDFSWVEPTFGRAFRAANVPTDPETSKTRSPLPDPESKMGQGTQWAVQQTSMHVHSAPGADTYHQEHSAYDTAATEGHTGDGVFEVDPAHVLHNTDWKPYNDPATGFVFWYNHVTNMSQWDCPPELSEEHNAHATNDHDANAFSEAEVSIEEKNAAGGGPGLPLAGGGPGPPLAGGGPGPPHEYEERRTGKRTKGRFVGDDD